MRKDDVKAFFLIFFILLLISTIVMLGINVYLDITEEKESVWYEKIAEIFSEGYKEQKVPVTQPENNGVLNQIASTGNQTQVTQPNISQEKEEFYYKQLEEYAKIIYAELKNNKENLKTGTYKISFDKQFNELLKQENGAEILQEHYQSAMETFLYDNPDVFYLDPTKMYINIQTTKKLFTTNYEVYIDSGSNANYLADGYNSKEQIIEYEKQIEQEVKKIVAKTSGKSDYQKILVIHDYLVENVAYDESVSKENIYNMYGTLVNKESVCEGYAKAFKYLMDQVGIESIVVIGSAIDSNGNMQNHAWNYVNFKNTWYAIDVTWDDPIILGGGKLSKKHKYKYFLKGSDTMSKDHTEEYNFVENGREYTHPILSAVDYK